MKKQKKKTLKKKNQKGKITKDMTFSEILDKHPEAAEVLFEKGMHCIGCAIAASESLEDGALAHGLDPDKLTSDINKKISKK